MSGAATLLIRWGLRDGVVYVDTFSVNYRGTERQNSPREMGYYL